MRSAAWRATSSPRSASRGRTSIATVALCLAFGAQVQMGPRGHERGRALRRGLHRRRGGHGRVGAGQGGASRPERRSTFLEFLAADKAGEPMELGTDVVIVGAGKRPPWMPRAWQARRVASRTSASSYRRTKRADAGGRRRSCSWPSRRAWRADGAARPGRRGRTTC